jgi:ATP-dependent helicase HrpB
MVPLPIDSALPQIVERLRENRCLVLVAPPGAGKTTRVPPAIVRAGLLPAVHPNLVMLQPRRVAARAAAQRIAEENGWELGREAGYHVRFDRKLTESTRIRVLTEGILTRQLLDDPFLPGIGAVLLDEFHERSLHTDVAIAFLREIQQTVRDDLILIVMSATLEAEPVAKFLGDCLIVRTEGRTYPIELHYAGAPTAKPQERLGERVVESIEGLSDEGDVLVFLPGAEEIRRTQRRLEPVAARHDWLVLPLHGSLPTERQTLALRPASRRKIILATNIAETSLTIDGVRTVIDSGLARVAGYDPRRGLDKLELKRISKASATQRAGRAGRTAPGQCIRLWAEREQRFLADFELPEIRRVDLAQTVLAMHAWGQSDPRSFGWYEPPAEEAIASAERLLEMLGALTAERGGKITPLGRRLMSLPVHPRLARLLLSAAEGGSLEEGAAIAALLSEKDILLRTEPTGGPRIPREQGPSDVLLRLDLLARAEADRFSPALRDAGIDPIAARQVAKTRDELLRICRRLPKTNRFNPRDVDLLKLPLLAYPDRVCRRRGGADRAVMVGGGGVKLAPESTVTQAEFFLALDARHDERSKAREALVRVASAIEVQWLEELFPQEIRRERDVIYDADRDRVVGRALLWYRDLLLHEDCNAGIDAELAARALAEAIRPQAAAIFQSSETAAALLARVAFLRQHMPEHPWPKFDDTELGDLLADACHGKRSIDEVRRAALVPLLMGRLPWPLDRLLDEHAPETITVPTGNRIRLTYSLAQPPVLAVRLQELFGWTDTPRLAGGRVPVLLHLLGPNYRPVQITDDLRSFWSTTYFQVRKDLRVRYPKHAWPEDPLTAKPVAKGRSHQ